MIKKLKNPLKFKSLPKNQKSIKNLINFVIKIKNPLKILNINLNIGRKDRIFITSLRFRLCLRALSRSRPVRGRKEGRLKENKIILLILYRKLFAEDGVTCYN